MDFFEHQERARRRSGVLIVSLAVTVILLVSALYFVCLHPYLAHLEKAGMLEGVTIDARLLWQPTLLAYVGAIVLGTIALAGLYKIVRVRKGGVALAQLLGAQRIDPKTSGPEERTLQNVVEEMAIASGIPALPVYVLETDSINAFAAGWNPSNAVIVVTRGCLTYLSRDELQAVIAHELSHVIHGDTGLNIRLLGLLHGITFIGLTGLALIKSIRHLSFKGKGEGAEDIGCAFSIPLLLVGVPLAAVGYSGVLAARITKSALAREREYLADAAAVQFTRNPTSLVSALEKIGGHEHGSRIFHPNAEQLSHFFFSEGVRSLLLKPSFFRGWFRCHPSLQDRIMRIDESFDGSFEGPVPLAAGNVAPSVGVPTPESVEHGKTLLQEIPQSLRRAVRDHGDCLLLLYTVLLGKNPRAQLEVLGRSLSPNGLRAVRAYHRAMAPLSEEQRLALVDLSAPALRELDDATRGEVLGRMAVLANDDARLDPFEKAIYAVIQRRLDASEPIRNPRRMRPAELAVVVSMMARAGHAGEAEAAAAYEVALSRAAAGIAMPERPLAVEEVSPGKLADALSRLAGLPPAQRKRVLDTCVHAALFDRNVTAREAALIRTVASALECPIPPIAFKS